MTEFVARTFLQAGLILLIAAFAAPSGFAQVCEAKIKEDKATAVRVADSLHIETFNTDPGLSGLWTFPLWRTSRAECG